MDKKSSVFYSEELQVQQKASSDDAPPKADIWKREVDMEVDEKCPPFATYFPVYNADNARNLANAVLTHRRDWESKRLERFSQNVMGMIASYARSGRFQVTIGYRDLPATEQTEMPRVIERLRDIKFRVTTQAYAFTVFWSN